MMPDFPHNIRIRLARLKNFLVASWCCSVSALLAVLAKLRQPTGQRESNIRTKQKKNIIGPILFLYYEESLASSNFNSKLFRFLCVRPNVNILYFHCLVFFCLYLFITKSKLKGFKLFKRKCKYFSFWIFTVYV